MSHKVVLAHRTARGWSGVHIQWGLPAWVLPDLHDRIRQAAKANPNAAGRQDPQDSQDPQAQWRAAMGSVIASDIAGRRTGYMRYPREPFERGNGVIGKRSTSWGIAHEVLSVLDEDTATIEISVRERCPEHGPQLAAHQQAEGVADRRVQSRQPTTCAWGVTDEVDEIRWLPVDAAASRLTYPRDRAVLDALNP